VIAAAVLTVDGSMGEHSRSVALFWLASQAKPVGDCDPNTSARPGTSMCDVCGAAAQYILDDLAGFGAAPVGLNWPGGNEPKTGVVAVPQAGGPAAHLWRTGSPTAFPEVQQRPGARLVFE